MKIVDGLHTDSAGKVSAVAGGDGWHGWHGWHARLALAFAEEAGTTRLVERSHSGPLRVQKPLYPEGAAVCHAIVVHPPGGVVGGDQLEITVRAGSGAHALLTTPGAAKWYKSNQRWSQQDVRLEAGAGACLEWLPQETIFFNTAQVQLNHSVTLAPDASYIGVEILCFGRTASGETFDAGCVRQRTEIRHGARLVWFEQGALSGAPESMQSPLSMAGMTVCVTLIAVGRPLGPAVLAAVRAHGAALPTAGEWIGATQMKSVLVARYLGNSNETAKQFMIGAWQTLRPALTGRPATVPRIWNT